MEYELPAVSESSIFFRSLKFMHVLPAQNAFSFDASAPVQTRWPPEVMVSRRVFQHSLCKWAFYVGGTTAFLGRQSAPHLQAQQQLQPQTEPQPQAQPHVTLKNDEKYRVFVVYAH